ncbi:MAG: hypothetical protein GXN92_03350 [Candidatus Micrarchaeota archaeon]|nr:hypothetical protein [Candidatus Micrarchaeota archaeon]
MIFKEGDEVTIIKGADKGKKAIVEGVEGNFLIVSIGGKTRKINPRHVQ